MNINIVIAVVAVLLLVGGGIWFDSKKSPGADKPSAPAVPPARGKFPPPAPIKDR